MVASGMRCFVIVACPEYLQSHYKDLEQDCSNSNIFLKPLFRGNFDPFVNNANLGAIAHMSKKEML